MKSETAERIGLTWTKLGIVAEQGPAIGTDDYIRHAHLKVNMRVVVGR